MKVGGTTTHYQTLGVSPTASKDEIKRVFRELSLKYHPDLQVDSEKQSSAEQFKAIANAHSILSNSLQRTKYDQQLTAQRVWRQTTSTGNRGFGGTGQWSPQSSSQARQAPVPIKRSASRYMTLGLISLGGVLLVDQYLRDLSRQAQAYNRRNALISEARSKNPWR